MTETVNFRRPTAETCRAARSQFGLTMPVLYDADGSWVRAMSINRNHWHIVLREGAEVEYRDSFDDRTFRTVVDRLLTQ